MSDVYRGTYLLASLTARTGEKTSDDDVTPSLTTAYPAETPSEVAECGPAVRSVEAFLDVSVDDRNGVKKKKKNEKRKKKLQKQLCQSTESSATHQYYLYFRINKFSINYQRYQQRHGQDGFTTAYQV